MGEAFVHRRNDRFRRQRDAHFAAQMRSSDLFRLCAPVMPSPTVAGFVLDDMEVPVGTNLWLGPDNFFYRGAAAIIRVDEVLVADIRRFAGDSLVIGRVVEVDVLGVAALEIGASP